MAQSKPRIGAGSVTQLEDVLAQLNAVNEQVSEEQTQLLGLAQLAYHSAVSDAGSGRVPPRGYALRFRQHLGQVRLSAADGYDYINANFVVGYKERKKFICAQGPMDNTVCDFWRMIWEQHLELILMLTNLEEYSKTKCAKFWPDDADGTKTFGEICVCHTGQKRYSDFIVRELLMSQMNGKKEEELPTIMQHHFLLWKDFLAPEHPSGILKFVKRVNEVYLLEKGSILVHCSAGVGRTGTLVALDSLLQQLADGG